MNNDVVQAEKLKLTKSKAKYDKRNNGQVDLQNANLDCNGELAKSSTIYEIDNSVQQIGIAHSGT